MKRMLADVCPELINEWSQRNLPLTPDSVTHGSNKIVWWNGKCGHEFSSLVATLLPRKTRGNLLQTKKLFQLAIAICGLNFFKKFSKSYFKNDLSQWVQVRGLFPSNRKRPFHEL